jgi:hypothetical protein
MLDKKANNFKVRYLTGTHRRKSGGYKCEGSITYPWRSVSRRKAEIAEKRFDQDTEVSREHSRLLDPTEGSNV